MKLAVVVWTLSLATYTCGSPVLSRVKRVGLYNEKAGDLEQKLEHLRSMLRSMDDKHKSIKSVGDSKVERTIREPMGSQETKASTNSRQDDIKMLAARLADGDRESLKLLEKVLGTVRKEDVTENTGPPSTRNSAGDYLGRSFETVKAAQTVRSRSRDQNKAEQEVEKDITALLRKFRHGSGSTAQEHSQDGSSRQPQQTIEEGHFGDFREEVLHAVENRILDDLKMALHSGFSVKEIINDLETTEGEWQEKKKREIERELDTLHRLGTKP